MSDIVINFIVCPLVIALLISVLLVVFSLINFNRTGPRIKQEIEENYPCLPT